MKTLERTRAFATDAEKVMEIVKENHDIAEAAAAEFKHGYHWNSCRGLVAAETAQKLFVSAANALHCQAQAQECRKCLDDRLRDMQQGRDVRRQRRA